METDAFDYYSTVEEDVLAKCKEKLLKACLTGVRFDLPGDHSRDLSGNGSASIEKVFRVFVPYYKISYRVNEKERVVEICASKKDFAITLDDDEKEALKYVPLDTAKIAAEKYQPQAKARNAMWIAALIATVLSGIIPIIGILAFIAIAVAIVLTVKHSKKYSAYKRELDAEEKKKRENILKEKHKEVYAVLCESLKEKQLADCTYEEVYADEN